MEHTQQFVNSDGLQIPLPFITQYGLHPGSEVTVELDDDVIRIVPKWPSKADLESRALHFLLKNLGDAVLVQVQPLKLTEQGQMHDGWRVYVYARGFEEPLGYLDYARNGQPLSEISSALDSIRQKASALVRAA